MAAGLRHAVVKIRKLSAANATLNRRKLLPVTVGLAPGLLAAGRSFTSDLLPQNSSSDKRRMVRFPEKGAMILLTDRASQLETPLHYFRQNLTPNNAFFVRWRLAGIPTKVADRSTKRAPRIIGDELSEGAPSITKDVDMRIGRWLETAHVMTFVRCGISGAFLCSPGRSAGICAGAR